ncbi:hypothetical protein PYCCODRAFT_849996 [Trametes coccinea BRFM310]|uniref:FHA domain-containing protein n=1 Tax=Trametes coccinea (strain BRFM310) TaxID=1353009 RepID=A0A1Y2IDN8_TRAC3|nr:hypothetical protein PYCCODRAFT_849996 [Trametes coccinea BRFM310]
MLRDGRRSIVGSLLASSSLVAGQLVINTPAHVEQCIPTVTSATPTLALRTPSLSVTSLEPLPLLSPLLSVLVIDRDFRPVSRENLFVSRHHALTACERDIFLTASLSRFTLTLLSRFYLQLSSRFLSLRLGPVESDQLDYPYGDYQEANQNVFSIQLTTAACDVAAEHAREFR